MGMKNQRTEYEWVNISDDLVYEWVHFFKGQVYEWGRFQNTGWHTHTIIIPTMKVCICLYAMIYFFFFFFPGKYFILPVHLMCSGSGRAYF